MTQLLWIGLGGALGSIARFLVGGAVQSLSRTTAFPWGILAVNVLGCLVIGALAQVVESRGVFSAGTRAFLFVGVIGGFTTFSTFGHDTASLARGGMGALALANVAANVVLGLGAVVIGREVVRALGG